ncbi:hypothetical protein J4481_00435 [Candidatus Pacearchaeota archaeon]|nr:hypothetical protein [Candidatus Pacearchaeota archaeon]
MELKVKAKQFGGSIGIILPREMISKEGILVEDLLKINVEKIADLDFMWGKGKDIKKSTSQIMKEIDKGEDD